MNKNILNEIQTYCRSLKDVLEYDRSDLEEVFCLNFVITREVFGEMKNFELIPGGEEIPVTLKNKYALRAYRYINGGNRKRKIKRFRLQAAIRGSLCRLHIEQIGGNTIQSVL